MVDSFRRRAAIAVAGLKREKAGNKNHKSMPSSLANSLCTLGKSG
jgi:hypothetical protein